MDRRRFAASLLGLSTLLAACPAAIDGGADSAPHVHVTGPLTGSTTWTAGNVYVLDTGTSISGTGCTLTIEPGVVVKIGRGGSLTVWGGCKLVANGAVFTSTADDVHGGDTDGVPGSVGAKGDWERIWVAVGGDGSSITDCEILYAGEGWGGALLLDAATTVTGTTVAHTAGAVGPFPEAEAALNAIGVPPGSAITGNTFFDNDVPLAVNGAVDVDDSNVFHDPAQPSITNARNRIEVSAGIAGPRSWSETEVPFFVHGLTVGAAGSLTLAPGVTVKLGGGQGVTVDGALIASGTAGAPVVFTSYRDASRGGDSWGATPPAPPTKGDWDRILLRGPGSRLDHCEILYAGYYNGNAVVIDGTSATVTGSTIAQTGAGQPIGPSAYEYASPALDAWRATATTEITANAIFDNVIPLGISGAFALGTSNVFTDGASAGPGNLYDAIFLPPAPTMSGLALPAGTLALDETDVPFVADDPRLPAGTTLALGDGVTLQLTVGSFVGLDGGTLTVPTGTATIRAWAAATLIEGVFDLTTGEWLYSAETGTAPFIPGLIIGDAANP